MEVFMIVFKNVKRAGDFGACADRDAGYVLDVLRRGYRAEYVDDHAAVRALITKSADNLDIVDVLALSCVDIQNEISIIINDDNNIEYRRIRTLILEKCKRALLNWGDGKPGEAFLRNPVGEDVIIKKEDFVYEI
jgi:hypothetical protein